MSEVKIFQDKRIRSIWNDEEEQWYFSVVDVIGAIKRHCHQAESDRRMEKNRHN